MNIWKKFYTRIPLWQNRPAYRAALLLLLMGILAAAALAGILFGPVRLTPEQLVSAIFSGDPAAPNYRILRLVRIPRVLAGALTGAALAVSGGILQSLLNNPLAAPNIIGINAGSGLFSILAAAFLPAGPLPVPAFLGALCTGMLVYLLAERTQASRLSVVLAGIAVGSLLSAGIESMLIFFPATVSDRIDFMIGGFSGVTMEQIGFASVFILPGLTGALLFSYDLNVLALGGETAASLGMNLRRTRFLFLVAATLLAGSAVSIAGLLGFVGLIIPNAARFAAGSDNRLLLPVCALMGAAFTLICDLAARLIFAPYEIPVGILLSFLGAPFFLALLFGQKRRGRRDSF